MFVDPWLTSSIPESLGSGTQSFERLSAGPFLSSVRLDDSAGWLYVGSSITAPSPDFANSEVFFDAAADMG